MRVFLTQTFVQIPHLVIFSHSLFPKVDSHFNDLSVVLFLSTGCNILYLQYILGKLFAQVKFDMQSVFR